MSLAVTSPQFNALGDPIPGRPGGNRTVRLPLVPSGVFALTSLFSPFAFQIPQRSLRKTGILEPEETLRWGAEAAG
jgi:hypothetical protein